MRSCATKLSSAKIQTQLGLCAAAVAGTAAVTSTAEAVIVTTFQNTSIPVPATFGGVYLDLANGATGGAGFAGWDFNPYQTASGLGFYWGADTIAGQRSGGVETAPLSALYADLALTGGSAGPASSYTSAIQGTSANYRNTGTHRLGLRFNNGGVFNYGYLDIQTTAGAGNLAGFPATILGWVYENSGAAITIPPIPEPTSVSLVALVAGAASVRSWRRRQVA